MNLSNSTDVTQIIVDTVKQFLSVYFNTVPKSIPVKVVAYNNITVDVSPLVSASQVQEIIKDVIVMKSNYNNVPINKDDIGLLIISNYDYSLAFDAPQFVWNAVATAPGNGYIFIPVTNKMLNYTKNEKANVLFSQDGNRSIAITDDDIVIADKKNTLTIDDKGIKIVDANDNTVEMTDKGITVTDKNNNSVKMTDSGIEVTDKNNNTIEMGNSGIKATDKNNNNIEMGSSGIAIKDSGGNSVEIASSGLSMKSAGGGKVEIMGAKVTINTSSLMVM